MEELKRELRQIVKKLYGEEVEVDVAVAPEDTGADYATNVAMKLAKVARKSPMAIAEELKAELSKVLADIEIEIAAPGFLNLKLADAWFAEQAEERVEALTREEYAMPEYAGKTVVTEFSDPNPFKVLHVGHLYTSVVGDSISRLLEKAGAKVKRANFGGDVGLHVGKTLWAMMQSDETSGRDMTIEEIAKCYVEGTRAYEENEVAKAEITELNKRLYQIAAAGKTESEAWEGEDGELARLYWRGRELSYQYFEDFYAKIGVKFDKFYPESTVVDKGVEEVESHIGQTYEESDGAIVYRGEKVGLHTRVFINAQGVPTYETKDVGLIFTKWDDYHFDESVVITGSEQTDYMKVVLASVSEYAPELVERTRHLTHGLVKLKGGVKMSSRKGNFLKAVEVLEMVDEKLQDNVVAATKKGEKGGKNGREQRNQQEQQEQPDRQGQQDRQKIVMAALKYAFLKYKMGGDIIFDPQESVSTTGNSGVYLLYSTVRAKKILQKMVERTDEIKLDQLNKKIVQENDGKTGEKARKERKFEKRLNKKVVQYDKVLVEAILEKAPYKICTYLYELAQEFSRFYENVAVAGSEREEVRVKMVKNYLGVMLDGLGLLGIEVPERM